MKFAIKHEIKGRLRVHMAQQRMTYEQADVLQYYLQQSDLVVDAKVYEQTADVVISYNGDRAAMIHLLCTFKYQMVEVPEGYLESTGRELNSEYKEKLICNYGKKLILPAPIRNVITIVNGIRYIWKGLQSLRHRRLDVAVLDATGIAVSLLRQDMGTAGSVMFLLGIGELLEEADQDTYDKLTSLVSGKTIVSYIDTDVIYPQIKQNPSAIYSFLLVAGYLKAVKVDSSFGIDSICELALPNKEISFVYNKEILQKLNRIIPQSIAVSVQEAIYSGDSKRIQELIHNLLLQSASSFDTAGENFYHGFMLGLCAMLSGAYTTSNRESGEGRYDIQMMPKRANLPGILIELKAGKKCTEETLKLLSETALQQINDRQYDTEMLSKGVSTIYKYGVAFSGKSVSVTVG